MVNAERVPRTSPRAATEPVTSRTANANATRDDAVAERRHELAGEERPVDRRPKRRKHGGTMPGAGLRPGDGEVRTPRPGQGSGPATR